MTANNGWPGKPGVPMNPERDGWHWVKTERGLAPWRWKENPESIMWEFGWEAGDGVISPAYFAALGPCTYLGPVLTPDEAAALQKRCEEAERTAQKRCEEAERTALQAAECHARETRRADALQKRVAELEGALRFYADPFKYTDIHGDDVRVPHFYSETDFGETARVALKGKKYDALIKKHKSKWVCPNNTPGCLKNCGNYGCGN